METFIRVIYVSALNTANLLALIVADFEFETQTPFWI